MTLQSVNATLDRRNTEEEGGGRGGWGGERDCQKHRPQVPYTRHPYVEQILGLHPQPKNPLSIAATKFSSYIPCPTAAASVWSGQGIFALWCFGPWTLPMPDGSACLLG